MGRPREKRPDPASSAIEDVLLGASRVQALAVATDLGVFDLLANGPRSSTLLASTTGVHPGALHRLLRFLAADGFLELAEDGRFSLAAPAEPLLATSRAGLREALLSTATRGWEVWRQLGHSVETGRPAFETVFGRDYFAEQRANPEALARFDVALAAGAAELGRELARTLRPAQLVCDLGCGSAALLTELLQAWPNARGIAFDAPGPLALAEQRLSDAGLASRYEACAGDFFAAVPPGADLYILAQLLHDWDDP
jgi:hypothetical protein